METFAHCFSLAVVPTPLTKIRRGRDVNGRLGERGAAGRRLLARRLRRASGIRRNRFSPTIKKTFHTLHVVDSRRLAPRDLILENADT